MFNAGLTLSLNFSKSWSQFLCHGCHTVAFVFTNQTTSTVVLGKISQNCYSHIHSPSLLSDVLALGNRGYKGHQINKHKFFSHANFITALWGDCKRFLCLAASYRKRIFSIVLKQKQKVISPWEEGQKDSWHSYFGVSCSTLLILQELPMENRAKGIFSSRRISLTEQASAWSRNQLAKEHRGLDVLHITPRVQCVCHGRLDLWVLITPRGERRLLKATRPFVEEVLQNQRRKRPLPLPSCLSHEARGTHLSKPRPRTGRDHHSYRNPGRCQGRSVFRRFLQPRSQITAGDGNGNFAADKEIKGKL